MDAKYDTALEGALATWIGSQIGEAVKGPFRDTLHNGVVLAK